MSNNIKRDLVVKYTSVGKDRFYRFLLSSAIFKTVSFLEKTDKNNIIKTPDIELIELYEKFLLFYRRENDEVYLDIAKLCRKAAHKIYRVLYKQKIVEKNIKFLNLLE